MKNKVKVCYVLSYKAPNYVRTTSLVDALKLSKDIELFQARNSNKGLLRYIQTFFRFLKIRIIHNPDVYIIGFRGHEIYWLLRIFALKKKFIFDEMMSPYHALVNERKNIKKFQIIWEIVRVIERSILLNAEYILTDTHLHKKFLTKTFDVNKDKIVVLPVGTNEVLFNPDNTEAKDFGTDFTVFFYGTFIPLHGVDVILKAAKLLEDYRIKFVIVGGKGKKKTLKNFYQLKNTLQLENLTHYKWVDYKELPKFIKGVDLCLGGPFGGTAQARRVISGKTYQFLCMGKPTVIGEIDEDVGFKHRENCILVKQDSPSALSEEIKWCYMNRENDKLDKIGESGRRLLNKEFSFQNISTKLIEIVKE
jgi:glycosyltransferase involved in cell wall biosynthesis